MLGVATEDLEQVRAWSFAINNSTGLESMGDVVIDPDDPDDLARIRARRRLHVADHPRARRSAVRRARFAAEPEGGALAIRKDPSLMASAVEEMLRFAPPVLTTGRMLDSAQDVAGCPLPQHASVSVSIVGGNRDPDVFERPDEFDVARKKNPHLAFGGGIHFCLGASARLQTRITRGWLFERYEEIDWPALPRAPRPWRAASARSLCA